MRAQPFLLHVPHPAAEHCLGNMQHIRGARALRESADSCPQLDARVGLVAVQLGLSEDAARLFGGCEAWDLLEQLHAAGGQWQQALQVAGTHDRCGGEGEAPGLQWTGLASGRCVHSM